MIARRRAAHRPAPDPDAGGRADEPTRRSGSILVKVLAGVGGGVVLLLLIAFIIGVVEGFTEGDR